MAKKLKLDDCSSPSDFRRYALDHGGEIKPASKGLFKAGKPDKGYVTFHQTHNGKNYHKHTKRYLVDQMKAIFVVLLVIGTVWSVIL